MEPGSWLRQRLTGALWSGIDLVRTMDPYVRPAFDATLRQPIQDAVQGLLTLRRTNEHLPIAQERAEADEDALTKAIIDVLSRLVEREYAPGSVLRAGNTKTYAVAHGELTVHEQLPQSLQHGVFATPHTFPAWVRFAGPGPYAPPDIRDNGILSIGLKLMDVPGPKLLHDEHSTQDFTAITAPTTTTATLAENLTYREHAFAGSPLGYFLNPRSPHLLALAMQALYARTHVNPLGARYWSCVPYLMGPDQAMKYQLAPTADIDHGRIGWNPPDDYLQHNLIRTLANRDITYDFQIQLQTDPHRMPVEDATVIWPERLSPHRSVATLTITQQEIDPAEQFRLADQLTFNPWHAVADHRPLGNQNRARRTIYQQLSQLRQTANGTPHREPTPYAPAGRARRT